MALVWSKECRLQRFGAVSAVMLLPAMILLAAGCSKTEDDEAGAEVDVSTVHSLFAEGFNGEPASGGAGAQAADATGDPRAGIPFDRSDSLTRRVEAAMAGALATDFSLRFAIADPGEFVKSGKVRAVWQRELAARNYSADTLAGATALMFGVAWELANGRKLSAADNAAILRQVTGKLRGDRLERENDEQRQLQADLRLITAGLWLEEAYLRAPFPDQMRELSDGVHRDMQRISSNDMRTTSVTAAGFSD